MLRQSERYCLRHGREGTLQRLRVASLDGLPVVGRFPASAQDCSSQKTPIAGTVVGCFLG